MKHRLIRSEYIFFFTFLEDVVNNTTPNNIMSLAGLSIMTQAYNRLPDIKAAHLKKQYSFTLKDYEAIFIYKLISSAQQQYAARPFESNVLRKINWEIYEKVISPCM